MNIYLVIAWHLLVSAGLLAAALDRHRSSDWAMMQDVTLKYDVVYGSLTIILLASCVGLLVIPACVIAVVFPLAHLIVPAGSPWVGMVISPIISLIVEIFFIFHFWGLAKTFPEPRKNELKRLVKGSILWGPPLLFLALFGGGVRPINQHSLFNSPTNARTKTHEMGG